MYERLTYEYSVTLRYVVLTEYWVPSDSVSTVAHSVRMIGRDHYQRVVFVSEIDSDLYSLGEFLCFVQRNMSPGVVVGHVNASACYQLVQNSQIKL